jgi:sulfofructose kinase
MLPSNPPAFDVVGLGVSPLDILALVDHFPTGEEVQQAFDINAQGGGPVATALAALSRLGCQTAMLDSIGDDWRGTLVMQEFSRVNVCTDYIRICPGCNSAAASILVHRGSGERAIAHFPGTAPELAAEVLPLDVIQNSKILHLNGRHLNACLKAISTAKAAGGKISFDGGAGRYRPEIRALIPCTDICIVASQFAAAFTNHDSVVDAARSLLIEGPSLVVITAGIQGSWIFDKAGTFFHQPAFLLENSVDTTGCGDSYHGAFLFGLLKGYSLPQTACFASAVAALNSLKLGGRAALPDFAAAIEFITTQVPGKYCF